jgi:hypothetical protein
MSEPIQDQINPNLERIDNQLDWIVKLYDKTIAYAKTDPEVSLILARKVAESICNQIFYAKLPSSNSTKSMMLNDVIDKLKGANALPKLIVTHLTTIQSFGNYSAHYQGEEDAYEVLDFNHIIGPLNSLTNLVRWYLNVFYNKKHQFGTDEAQGSKTDPSELNVQPLPELTAAQQIKKPLKPNPAAKFSQEGELTLSDDFTGKRPIAIALGASNRIVIKSWKDVLVETCQLFIQLDENKFRNLENINGMKISTKSTGMTKPMPILDSLFIETNLSANAIRDLIKRILVAYARDSKEYKVYFGIL